VNLLFFVGRVIILNACQLIEIPLKKFEWSRRLNIICRIKEGSNPFFYGVVWLGGFIKLELPCYILGVELS